MLKVGLTGGLASGKSFVGHALEELGCLLVEADKLGHEVLLPGAEAYDATVAEFGREVLLADGTIDRKALAALVFGKPERLEVLNRIVHPPVRARGASMEQAFAAVHPDGIAVHEAAILIETGSYKKFDRMIVAVCTEEQQIERAMHRDGASRESVMDRLARQMPLREKTRFAHFVIDTSGSKENTLRQTEAVYRELRKLADEKGSGDLTIHAE
ncbi:MAG: dephospho-CoA kinase [Bryobacteraceae bacterium]